MDRGQDAAAHALTLGKLYSVPRLLLDLVFWSVAVVLSVSLEKPWITLLAITWIGAVPMHDLLVHGHEGVHRHIARNRWVNRFFTWFSHALVGISGTAYQAFHLDHHRRAHTEQDPEYRLLNGVVRGVPGWAYLAIPFVAHVAVNTYLLSQPTHRGLRWRVAADAFGIVVLHGGVALAVGPLAYLLYVVAPIFTSLSAVVALRSLCEHHAAFTGDPWTNTRTLNAGRLLGFLWSNTTYHLEHHLYPSVPYHQLPTLRRLLAGQLVEHGSFVDRGFLRTAFALLREPLHLRQRNQRWVGRRPSSFFVDTRGLAFRMKVRWFRDVLRHAPARRHLWSLYYAGEAYEALHPQGVFVTKLADPLGKLLAKQLSDETRHAAIFRELLAQEGLAPIALPPEEDVGWYLLTHVVPDVVERGQDTGPFTHDEARRYMAFLHVLELRSLSDLCALIAAARSLGEMGLVCKLETILPDERFHASYTHSAVFRMADTPRDARRVLDRIRRAERKHYTHALNRILSHFEALGTTPPDIVGRLRWGLMKGLARLGLAVPLLPVYDRLPSEVVPSPQEV